MTGRPSEPAAGRRGFSLVEIAFAAAVFGGGVIVVLALVGALLSQAGTAGELVRLQAAGDAARVELRRRVAVEGLAAFGARLPPWDESGRGGTVLTRAGSADPWDGERSGMRLEAWRAGATGSSFLIVVVRVSGLAGDAAPAFPVVLRP